RSPELVSVEAGLTTDGEYDQSLDSHRKSLMVRNQPNGP
ncbi:hypothetical protein LINGRAHAP2_LOCUS14106, partial [Linum grandiflorum]